MDGEQIQNSCFSPDLLPTGEKKLQTRTRTREEALLSCYLNLLPSSDPQWGLLFFLPLIYNPVSHHVMTSPREFDFTSTHTSHWKQDEPLGHPGLCAASPLQHSPGTLSSKKSLGVAMTEPPTFQALRELGGFLYHSSPRQHSPSCPLAPPSLHFPSKGSA